MYSSTTNIASHSDSRAQLLTTRWLAAAVLHFHAQYSFHHLQQILGHEMSCGVKSCAVQLYFFKLTRRVVCLPPRSAPQCFHCEDANYRQHGDTAVVQLSLQLQATRYTSIRARACTAIIHTFSVTYQPADAALRTVGLVGRVAPSCTEPERVKPAVSSCRDTLGVS